MNYIIELKDIAKSYEESLIFSNVNCKVPEGLITALIGLNGMGKTTLIKIILGLVKPDAGNVFLNGNILNANRRAEIFYLPEKFMPNPLLKAREYIRFVLSFYNINFDENHYENLKQKFNLPEKYDNLKISEYSKGMTQKLGLIAMVMSKRKIWIIDEPTTGLDVLGRKELRQIMEDHKNNGGTVLFTSHIMPDIIELSDCFIAIKNHSVNFYSDKSNINQDVLV